MTDERLKARRQLIHAANRFAVNATPAHRAPWTMRHIQRCVGICRRQRLDKPEILAAAGFNPRTVKR